MSENENKDLLTDEELEKEPEGDQIDWEAEAKKARATAKRYHTSHKQFQELKRAQADAEVKTKADAKKSKPEAPVEKINFDYGELAYLEAKGVSDRDHDFLLGEAKSTGKELKDLLGFQYVQEELKLRKEARTAQDALPAGSGRSTSSGSSSAEYWYSKLQRDEITLAQIPDTKLRREVRKMKEKASGGSSSVY